MFKKFKKIFFIFGLLSTFNAVYAGSFMVDPVRVNLDTSQKSSSLTVNNNGKTPSIIQVKLMSWSQINGEDVLMPSNDVFVSPPIVTVHTGGKQVLRLALRRALDPEKELAYRLILQEVPPPPALQKESAGLQVALRISIPVFAASSKSLAPKMQWKLTYVAKDHAIHAELTNSGNAHLQLYEFAFQTPNDNKNVAFEQSAVYVLPSEKHEWVLKLTSGAQIDSTKLKLKAKTEMGDVEQVIDLDKL